MNSAIKNEILYDERLSGRHHRLLIRIYYAGLFCLFLYFEYFLITIQTEKISSWYYIMSIYLLIIFIAVGIISIVLQILLLSPIQILSNGIASSDRNLLDLLIKRPTIILFENIQQIEINDRGPIKIKLKENNSRDIYISRDSIIDLRTFIKSIPEKQRSKLKLQDML